MAGDRQDDRRPVFLLDGDCGFCRRWAAWLEQRVGSSVHFQAFQDLDRDERFGLTADQLEAASYLIDESGTPHRGSDGFARALSRGRGPWALVGRAMTLPGFRWLARSVYQVVSRNRHRLPAP